MIDLLILDAIWVTYWPHERVSSISAPKYLTNSLRSKESITLSMMA